MMFEQSNHKGVATAIAFVVALLVPVAGFSQETMDEAALLEALAQADRAEAIHLERELQALWNKSGSPAMDLLLERGRKANEEGDLRGAIEHLTALTDHAPDFAEGWFARASVFFASGLYGPALADLERALSLNPNNYNAIIGLAALLERFEDPERAYVAYLRAQAIHPHHEEVTKALDRLKPHIEGKTL